MAFRLHNPDQIEGMEVKLSDFPIAFQNRCEEYVEQGQASSMDEARAMLKDEYVFLELYYEKGYALFGVDSQAVESLEENLSSPYSRDYAEKTEED